MTTGSYSLDLLLHWLAFSAVLAFVWYLIVRGCPAEELEPRHRGGQARLDNSNHIPGRDEAA